MPLSGICSLLPISVLLMLFSIENFCAGQVQTTGQRLAALERTVKFERDQRKTLQKRVTSLQTKLTAAEATINSLKEGISFNNGWEITPHAQGLDIKQSGTRKFIILNDGNYWSEYVTYGSSPKIASLEFGNGWKIDGITTDVLKFQQKPANSGYTDKLMVFGDGNLWMARLAGRFPNDLKSVPFPNPSVQGMVC